MRVPRSVALVAAFVVMTSACGGTEVDTAPVDPTTTAPVQTTTTPPTPSTTSSSTTPDNDTGVIGHSVLGRPLVATTIGSGPRRVYVIGSIHGDERTAADTSDTLLDLLPAGLPAGVTVRWLVDANPDGTAARTRDNAAGIDLNRNWPTGHEPGRFHGNEPLSEPETRALAADIAAFRPGLIVAMHSAREGPFVDPDGPADELAHAFALGASGTRVWEVVPDVAWMTPGSLGSHFGEGVGIPVVTVEGNRWDTPSAVVPEVSSGLERLLRSFAEGGSHETAPVCTDHAIGESCSDPTRAARRVLSETTGSNDATFLVKEVGGVVLAAQRADWPVYPASAIKTLHLVALLQRVETDIDTAFRAAVPLPVDGCAPDPAESPESESLGLLVDRMMIDSDNEAANAIQAFVGLDALAATATAAGMADTAIHHGFGCGGPANAPANVTSVADLARLYDAALVGLLDRAARNRLREELLDVTDTVVTNDSDPISGARVLVKDGWYGDRRTIAGIALLDGRTLAFAIHVHTSRLEGPGSGLVEVVEPVLDAVLAPAGG